MQKRFFIAIVALAVLGLTGVLATGFHSLIPAKLVPATVYLDGKEIKTGEQKGYYFNGTSNVPSAIEYQGTVYVPIQLVGDELNKKAGWDTSAQSVWLGNKPALHVSQQASQPIGKTASVGQQASQATGKTASVEQTIQEERGLFGLDLGDTEQQVIGRMGKPVRREFGSLGYEWLIYNRDLNRYLQVGIRNGKVVDLYSNAPLAKIGNVSVGTSYQSLSRKHELKQIVSFPYLGAQIQITNQIKERPLALDNDKPIIFYLDKQNGSKVTSLRIIDKLALLQGGFYETKWSYQGTSPNFDPPALTIKQLELANATAERQILDLVNVIRYRYKLPALSWNNDVAKVAKRHSIDMENHNYFQHVSSTTGLDPFQRLKQAGISYQLAGENIAAGFPDAIEASESWMNSPGHRKNILEKGFTQLGTGVYADYFTQNFVTLKKTAQP